MSAFSSGPREVYVEAINSLPLVQTPEIFGLHSNADISYYTNATKAISADLMDLQPRSGSIGAVRGMPVAVLQCIALNLS